MYYSGKVLDGLLGGVTRATIGAWRKEDLLPPRPEDRRRGYTFTELLAIKVILRLKDWGASTQEIKSAVRNIKKEFPEIKYPLIEKTLFVCGKAVCMLVDGKVYEPSKGQFNLLALEDLRLEDCRHNLMKKVAPFLNEPAASQRVSSSER